MTEKFLVCAISFIFTTSSTFLPGTTAQLLLFYTCCIEHDPVQWVHLPIISCACDFCYHSLVTCIPWPDCNSADLAEHYWYPSKSLKQHSHCDPHYWHDDCHHHQHEAFEYARPPKVSVEKLLLSEISHSEKLWPSTDPYLLSAIFTFENFWNQTCNFTKFLKYVNILVQSC